VKGSETRVELSAMADLKLRRLRPQIERKPDIALDDLRKKTGLVLTG
jgi:hypothetical protein